MTLVRQAISHPRRRRRRGFTLVVAVLMIGAVGVAVAVLTHGASLLAEQSRQQMLAARVRTLQASAVAWARHSTQNLKVTLPAQAVTLDVAALQLPNAQLQVQAAAPVQATMAPAGPALHVEVRCALAGRSAHRSADFFLPAR